jgi:hypothetical protein
VPFCPGCTNHMSRATMSQKPAPEFRLRASRLLGTCEGRLPTPSVCLPPWPQAILPKPTLSRDRKAQQIVPVAIWTSAHCCVSDVHPGWKGLRTDMVPSAPWSPSIFSRSASHVWQLSAPKLLIHLTLVGVASDRYELLTSE